MKLAFHCVKCGKLLGFYEGEEFVFVWEGLQQAVKVFCKECDPLTKKKRRQ
jgi:hypothetical protein